MPTHPDWNIGQLHHGQVKLVILQLVLQRILTSHICFRKSLKNVKIKVCGQQVQVALILAGCHFVECRVQCTCTRL